MNTQEKECYFEEGRENPSSLQEVAFILASAVKYLQIISRANIEESEVSPICMLALNHQEELSVELAALTA